MTRASVSLSGHRHRKKTRTRERLIDAALRLFDERGYEATRIDDIVAEVDLAPRTFFRYFGSKDDTLFGLYDGFRHTAHSALGARPSGEGVVHALIASHMEIARAHHAHERSALCAYRLLERSPELRRRFAVWRRDMHNYIAAALAKRLPERDSLTAEIITAAVLVAFTDSANKWAADGASRPLEDYWRTTSATLLKLLAGLNERYVLR